jgi:archaellum component FlaF (FlaF/FlaG flagellin family)
MSRRRKAVSEVVASLVILLIISVLGTSLYTFSMTVMRSQQESLQNDIEIETARAKERLKVVYVVWDGSSDDLNVSVLNCGRLEMRLVDMYVNGVKVSTYLGGLGGVIPTSGLTTVSFTSPVGVVPDSLYQFVIISERGVTHVHSWQS